MKRSDFLSLLGYGAFGLVLIFFISWCQEPVAKSQAKYNPQNEVRERSTYDERFNVVTIDGCEYIVYRHYEGGYQSYSSGITHKGNCKNHKK
jgi:hypothetical protein